MGTQWRSFVAVGDSFTEGLDDRYPDGSGYRGWADIVAAELAARSGDVFRYANLAVRGRLFPQVVSEQVPLAAAMAPDLVSFAAGGNDMLRRHFDPAALLDSFDKVVGQLRETGADVLVFRFADVTTRLPGRRMILPRLAVLNRAVGDVAERHGARLVDMWSDHTFHDPRLWSVDRLHLNAAGHLRVAALVLRALDVEPEPGWLASPGRMVRKPWLAARGADARWVGRHLAPWVRRRLTGRSSGDLVEPKRPTLADFPGPETG